MFDPVVLMIVGTAMFWFAIGFIIAQFFGPKKELEKDVDVLCKYLYILTDNMPGATGMLPSELVEQIIYQDIYTKVRG